MTLNEQDINDNAPVAIADSRPVILMFNDFSVTVLVNDSDVDSATLIVAQFATNASGAGAQTANGSNTITTVLGGNSDHE